MNNMHTKIYFAKHCRLAPLGVVLMWSLVGFCFSETTDLIKTLSSSKPPHTTVFAEPPSTKPLAGTVASSTATSTTKGSAATTARVYASPLLAITRSPKKYSSTKGQMKSARRQKFNTSSSGVGALAHSPASLEERLGAVDCDLPVLPRESRLWRGNETHELNLPLTVSIFSALFAFILTHLSYV